MQMGQIPKPMLCVSVYFPSAIATWTQGNHLDHKNNTPSLVCTHSLPVNPFLPSCAGLGKRYPQTEVVHIALADESNLQMMALDPLLLSLIMSNLYISHKGPAG